MRKILKLGAEPTVTVMHNSRRYGATPMPAFPKLFVEIFIETIKDGKIRWKRIGEARLDEKHGLHGLPYSLPYEASLLLTEALQELE